MKLATVRLDGRTAAVRIDGDQAVETGAPDVGTLLRGSGWRERAAAAAGPRHPAGRLDYAPLVPRPSKIICVGLNYRAHILETGMPVPQYPTLFATQSGSVPVVMRCQGTPSFGVPRIL